MRHMKIKILAILLLFLVALALAVFFSYEPEREWGGTFVKGEWHGDIHQA